MLTVAVCLGVFLLFIVMLILVKIANLCARNVEFLYSIQEIVNGLRKELKEVSDNKASDSVLEGILDNIKDLAMYVKVDLHTEVESVGKYTLESSLELASIRKQLTARS